MGRLIRLLTPWHDEEESNMKDEQTNKAVEDAQKGIAKTKRIVTQYKLAGVIIAQERSGSAQKQ